MEKQEVNDPTKGEQVESHARKNLCDTVSDTVPIEIGFDQGVGKTFLGVWLWRDLSLGSVSPVFDLVQGRRVPFYLPAYGGGASAWRFGDETHGLTLFPGDGYLLTFFEGQMGIAFTLRCAGLEHNGITPC